MAHGIFRYDISLSLRWLAKQPYCDGTHKKIGFKS